MSKKHKYMLLIMLLSIIFAAINYFLGKEDGYLKGDNTLLRNEWGSGEYSLKLKADIDGESLDELSVTVTEREYTEEEITYLAAYTMAELNRVILNGNSDLEHIKEDMYLPTSLSAYPFNIRWSVSDEDVMDRSGKLLCKRDRTESFDVVLKARLIYREYDFNLDIGAVIVPPDLTEKESLLLRLKELLNGAVSENETQKEVKLPESVEGRTISWSEEKENRGALILLAGFIGAIAVGIAYEYDEKAKKRKIGEELEILYAPFVEKLKLYMVSGLTVKNAFIAITEGYEKSGKKENEALLLRLKTACNKFKNNVREETVYEEWGNECMGPYKRLSFLLNVNLKQGNSRLLDMLNEEVENAHTRRKELAKKKGDEAGVKLLFPMVLMLIAVMLLIMLPAYMDIV